MIWNTRHEADVCTAYAAQPTAPRDKKTLVDRVFCHFPFPPLTVSLSYDEDHRRLRQQRLEDTLAQ
jgi:hypothetical protein